MNTIFEKKTNIGLVEVQTCTILKDNICDNIFWPLQCAFTPTLCQKVIVDSSK
jgi:hypothetical protein